MSSSHAPAPGALFERYRLLSLLSQNPSLGGQTQSYLAIDGENFREVEVLLRPEDELTRRFAEEGSRARRIDHPTLPGFQRLGQSQGRLFAVQAWKPTLPISTLLGTGTLNQKARLGALSAVFEALSQLHAHGLAHGGVRLTNLHALPGKGWLLRGYEPGRGLRPDSPPRPIRFLPPEWKLSGISPQGDLFAFAVLAVEVLSGRPLFPEDAPLEASHDAFFQAPDKATFHPVLRLPHLGAWLRTLLERDPAKRPAGAFAEAETWASILQSAGVQPGEPLPPGAFFLERRSLSSQLQQLAQKQRKSGDVLPAAVSLRTLQELDPTQEIPWVQSRLEEAQELLWNLVPSSTSAPGERLALGLVLHRWAEVARQEEFRNAVRLALGRLSEETDSAKAFATWLPNPELLKELEAYDQTLLEHAPQMGLALFRLALTGEVRERGPGETVAAYRLSLAHQRKLLHTALVLFGDALQKNPESLDLEAEVQRLTRELGQSTSSPGSFPGLQPPETLPPSPPPSTSGGLEEAIPHIDPERDERILKAFETAVQAKDWQRIQEGFRALTRAKLWGRDEQYSRLHGILKDLLWLCLLEAAHARMHFELLKDLVTQLRPFGFQSLVQLFERTLLLHLPSEGRAPILTQLLADNPGSLPILQLASREAMGQGDETIWLRQLEAAGQCFLKLGEMMPASKIFMGMRSVDPSSPAAQRGMGEVFRLGEAEVEARTEFKKLGSELKNAASPQASRQLLEEYLTRFPTYVPALESLASLARATGDRSRAGDIRFQLAHRAILREEEGRALDYLRQVLSEDPEHDEALVYLAITTCFGENQESPRARNPLEWKTDLLRSQELYPAALHFARRLVQEAPSSEKDAALYRLIDLAPATENDPSPHYQELAQRAMRREDYTLARGLLRQGLDRAQNRDGVFKAWMSHPELSALMDETLLASSAGETMPYRPG